MPYFNGIAKPSEQLADYLMGKTRADDTPSAVASWARKSIHDAACKIIDEPSKGERRNMLGRVPLEVRSLVEDQVKLHWKIRRDR